MTHPDSFDACMEAFAAFEVSRKEAYCTLPFDYWKAAWLAQGKVDAEIAEKMVGKGKEYGALIAGQIRGVDHE